MTIHAVISDLNGQKFTIFSPKFYRKLTKNHSKCVKSGQSVKSGQKLVRRKQAYFDQNPFNYVSDIFYK